MEDKILWGGHLTAIVVCQVRNNYSLRQKNLKQDQGRVGTIFVKESHDNAKNPNDVKMMEVKENKMSKGAIK